MDSHELSDKLEEQAHESETEGELAEPAESDDMELTHDDLDEATGGRSKTHGRKRIIILPPIQA